MFKKRGSQCFKANGYQKCLLLREMGGCQGSGEGRKMGEGSQRVPTSRDEMSNGQHGDYR